MTETCPRPENFRLKPLMPWLRSVHLYCSSARLNLLSSTGP